MTIQNANKITIKYLEYIIYINIEYLDRIHPTFEIIEDNVISNTYTCHLIALSLLTLKNDQL